jgi:hypothetical protein
MGRQIPSLMPALPPEAEPAAPPEPPPDAPDVEPAAPAVPPVGAPDAPPPAALPPSELSLHPETTASASTPKIRARVPLTMPDFMVPRITSTMAAFYPNLRAHGS